MITKSAKKAYRQNLRRNARNLQVKSALQKVLKNYKKLVLDKKFDAAKGELSKVYQALDKTAKAGVIKKNKASRLKSRLTALVNKK
ncbi:MAG: 30S ribosomal protein S20 [bacterium]|nr:30S ribosomal protein S20 [bacterium]